jgi:hypothetical protein
VIMVVLIHKTCNVREHMLGSDKPPESTTVSLPEPTSAPTSTVTTTASPSSPNQPLTFYIPQPCKNEYKSIPGGSLEMRCFN